MHFAIHAIDRNDAGDLRLQTRPNHLKYLEDFEILYAGPLLDENQDMCGSLIVFEADDLEDAKKIASDDPYAKAGLFSQVHVTGYKPAIGPK